MASLEQLMQGTIDMHVHFGPDPVLPRRVNAFQAAIQAQETGMRAIVLKSHSYPTAPLAFFASEMAPNVSVFGSLCLDFEVGGINPFALETSAILGAKVVWMPTLSAINSRAKMAAMSNRELKGEGISILTSAGQLIPEVVDMLPVMKDHGIVLASGHISPAETFALVNECQKIGLSKIVVTHPLDTHLVETPFTIDQLRSLGNEGAFIEHCFVALLPTQRESNKPREVVEVIKAVGAEHCIISSDLGQAWNLPPAEGLRMFMATLLKHGCTEDEINLMAKTNPARLLDLPPE